MSLRLWLSYSQPTSSSAKGRGTDTLRIWLTPSLRPSSSCSKVEEINICLLLGRNDSDSNSPNSIHCCITPHIQAVVQVHHGASRDSGTGRTHFLSFYPSSFWESLCPQKHCIRFRTVLVCISETPCHT